MFSLGTKNHQNFSIVHYVVRHKTDIGVFQKFRLQEAVKRKKHIKQTCKSCRRRSGCDGDTSYACRSAPSLAKLFSACDTFSPRDTFCPRRLSLASYDLSVSKRIKIQYK